MPPPTKRKNASSGPKNTKKVKKPPPRPVPEPEEEEESSSSDLELIWDPANPRQPHSRGHSEEEEDEDKGEEEEEEEEEEEVEPGDGGQGDENSTHADEEHKSEPEATPTVQKRKRGPSKKQAPGTTTPAAAEATEETKSITYNMLIFSLVELAKPQRTRREGVARFLDLPHDLEWIDFQSRLAARVADVLFPGHANVPANSFRILFTITRHVPDPLPLASAEDYKHLLKCTGKMKTPTVKIIVNQLVDLVDKENIPPAPAAAEHENRGGGNNTAKGKKKKSHIPTEKDILPGNAAKNDKIKRLRERWVCNVNNCKSEHCFVPADGTHFPLSHDHFDKWAAAMLHSEGDSPSATLENPPNIREFDPVSAHAIASKSPVLQARIKAMAKEKDRVPIVQLVLPDNPRALYPNTVHVPDVQPSGSISSVSGDRHPLASYGEGPKLDISTFCAAFCLSEDILQRFQEHKISGTHAFAHINERDLENMKFAIGELIDLKEAVKIWAISK